MSSKNPSSESAPINQVDLFWEIWQERNHFCQICSAPVQWAPITFMHVLSKGAYPRFKLLKENIVIGCPTCHMFYDQQTGKAKADPRFMWVFELAEKLKQQYYAKS